MQLLMQRRLSRMFLLRIQKKSPKKWFSEIRTSDVFFVVLESNDFFALFLYLVIGN